MVQPGKLYMAVDLLFIHPGTGVTVLPNTLEPLSLTETSRNMYFILLKLERTPGIIQSTHPLCFIAQDLRSPAVL